MFAVFSLSKNLLLVPDTRTLSAEDYPHLMHLDHPKLVKVFAAALEVVDFLNEEFSHQQKQIKFHVGRARQDGDIERIPGATGSLRRGPLSHETLIYGLGTIG